MYIERKDYYVSVNNIGKMNVYYDFKYEDKMQSIVYFICSFFDSKL
ncbi:TPA: hypothetical protein KQG29_002125 [Clostridioides difficile]|nr:hypothetical protein [Clostridioides difficile]